MITNNEVLKQVEQKAVSGVKKISKHPQIETEENDDTCQDTSFLAKVRRQAFVNTGDVLTTRQVAFRTNIVGADVSLNACKMRALTDARTMPELVTLIQY
jgi:hypothetical protein